jgi:cytochrome c peroxidase
MSFAALRLSSRRIAAAGRTAPFRVATQARGPAFRRFSTAPETEPKSSSSGLWWGLGALALGAGGYYLYTETDIFPGPGTPTAKPLTAKFVPTREDYQKVYNQIAKHLDADYEDGSYGPVFVRLAWHSSGTYDKETGTGGSNYATMRFAPESLHGANNGLGIARGEMEKIKAEFPWISYGDLWTLGGVAAIQEMQGPKIPWRAGRIDGFEKDVTPDGRLPDGAKAQDHLRDIFYRMGFNDRDIVALSGAHALGRCHTDRSGFEGPWTFSPTTFTNDFFTLLLNEKWVWKKWNGPKQYIDKKTGSLMMLPSDMALIQDKKFKEWVVEYSANSDLFFHDFSKAFSRLLELGVPEKQWAAAEPWVMKTLDEQNH